MSKLDILRKIIREEVALAIRVEFKALLREELLPLLKENKNIIEIAMNNKFSNGIERYACIKTVILIRIIH